MDKRAGQACSLGTVLGRPPKSSSPRTRPALRHPDTLSHEQGGHSPSYKVGESLFTFTAEKLCSAALKDTI